MNFRALVVIAASLCVLPTFAQSPPYQSQTVLAAQEALDRLGYDVGTPDGAWGPKSRAAMNALRAENGLPEAEDFVGSSLWLVHRESPGETTLADPGLDIIDLQARRAEIEADGTLALMCNTEVGLGKDPKDVPAPDVVSPIAIPNGFITGDDDWYSPIHEGLVEAQGKCIAGSESACEGIIDLASRWAEADALEPGVGRNGDGAEDVYWIANALLRSVIFAYNTASAFEAVEPEDHAVILDWLKRRIDQYHYAQRVDSGQRPGDANYFPGSNHALTHMMPAMAFGALVGDRSMMEPAFERREIVLSTMRDDGSIPTETRRGARWFHYSTMQLSLLLNVELVAARHGIELASTSDEQSVPNLMRFLSNGLADFDLAVSYAKANQGPGPSDDFTVPYVKEFHFGAVPAYRALYGDDASFASLQGATLDSKICSPDAKSDQKFRGCRRVGDEAITLVRVVQIMGPQPDQNIGFPAGCFMGAALNPLE